MFNMFFLNFAVYWRATGVFLRIARCDESKKMDEYVLVLVIYTKYCAAQCLSHDKKSIRAF